MAALVLALHGSVYLILKSWAEMRKVRAGTKKIEADTHAAECRRQRNSHQRVRDCAGDLIED